MAFFAGRRRGLVVGAVVGAKVASNKAHAQEQQKAEMERQKQEMEYEKKLREQEDRYKKQLEEEKKKSSAPQYYDAPAQMTYAYQRSGSTFSQPAPPGVVPAVVPAGPPPVLGAPPKLVKARVLASYAANSAAELSIQEGEEVVFLRNDPSGWAEVTNRAGKRGFVPQTFIQVLK